MNLSQILQEVNGNIDKLDELLESDMISLTTYYDVRNLIIDNKIIDLDESILLIPSDIVSTLSNDQIKELYKLNLISKDDYKVYYNESSLKKYKIISFILVSIIILNIGIYSVYTLSNTTIDLSKAIEFETVGIDGYGNVSVVNNNSQDAFGEIVYNNYKDNIRNNEQDNFYQLSKTMSYETVNDFHLKNTDEVSVTINYDSRLADELNFTVKNNVFSLTASNLVSADTYIESVNNELSIYNEDNFYESYEVIGNTIERFKYESQMYYLITSDVFVSKYGYGKYSSFAIVYDENLNLVERNKVFVYNDLTITNYEYLDLEAYSISDAALEVSFIYDKYEQLYTQYDPSKGISNKLNETLKNDNEDSVLLASKKFNSNSFIYNSTRYDSENNIYLIYEYKEDTENKYVFVQISGLVSNEEGHYFGTTANIGRDVYASDVDDAISQLFSESLSIVNIV